MNNNKKGFTLVELIVTIAIMLAIVGITIPSVVSMTSKNNKRTHDLQVNEFLSSAKSYVLDNKVKWNAQTFTSAYATETNPFCISLDDLVESEYIEEIPDDPLTKEKFKGSINIYVKNDKLKYKYSNDECTNNLVTSGLSEINNYDEYLNIGDILTSGDYIGDAVKGLIENSNLVTSTYSETYNSEPGIKLYNDGETNIYFFVGPVENNYVKINGLIYPEDVDYTGQSGNDVLWRVLSVDNKTGTIRMISDAGIYEGQMSSYTNYSLKDSNNAAETFKVNNSNTYQKLINWFNTNAVNRNSALFEKTQFCNSYINKQKVSPEYETGGVFSPTEIKKCSYANGTNHKFIQISTNYVGLLSIPEFILLGGGEADYADNTMFRYNYKSFWSTSAKSLGYTSDYYVPRMYTINKTFSSSDNNGINSFRPVITLSSGAQFAGGNGTKSNPYIVNM